jgi:DNA-binding protein YbaB/chitodextrinase
MSLPTPESLLPGTVALERALARLESELAEATYSAAGPGGTITAVATGTLELASLSIAPAEHAGQSPEALAAKVRAVCAAALAQASTAGALRAAGDAAGYQLPGLPGASLPPPTADGFDRAIGRALAAAPGIEAHIRGRRFEGRDGRAGSVRAVVDGALEIQSLSFGPPLPATAPELASAALAAINVALTRAKNLFEDTAAEVVDDVTMNRPGQRPADARPRALLVVENAGALRAADELIRARLTALGFNVDVRKAPASASADANGRALVLISESVEPADVGTKFTNAKVPMLVCEPVSFRDLKMTGGTWQTDKGDIADQTKLQISGGHPLAAGLDGLVTLTSSPSKFVWGKPAAAAVKPGAIVGKASAWGIFGYDTGDAMVGLNAPARRVGFFLGRDTATALTVEGWRLFDAAVHWATASRALFTVGSLPLVPGDQALRDRLAERHGLEVLVRLDTDGKTSDLGDVRVHVIAETVSSTDVGSRFLSSPAPSIVCEANLFDDMKLTGAVKDTDFGEVQDATSLDISDPGHALAAGLVGRPVVVGTGHKFAWGKPAAEAARVAAVVGRSDAFGVFAYEGGANMVGARAAAPRVGLFASSAAAPAFTPEGWSLFDAAVRWARAPRVLLVVGAVPLRPDDEALRKRLENSFGFVVDVKLARDALDVHGNGKNVIVLSESVSSGDVAGRFTSVAVPVVSLEPSLFDDLKMTGTVSNTDFGVVSNQTELEIVNAGHPLASELPAGRVTVATAPSRFGWGRPTATAVKVARVVGKPDDWALFGYEAGVTMSASKVAPARRVGCFVGENTSSALHPVGWRLFEGAILWAAGRIEVLAGTASLPDLVRGAGPPPAGAAPSPPTAQWKTGVSYAIGDEVVFDGKDYRCRQAHLSQSDWTPPQTPALWARINAGTTWTVQVSYSVGDEVTHLGLRYRCLQGHQAAPGQEPPNAPALWHRIT